jgi:hypothetical protein
VAPRPVAYSDDSGVLFGGIDFSFELEREDLPCQNASETLTIVQNCPTSPRNNARSRLGPAKIVYINLAGSTGEVCEASNRLVSLEISPLAYSELI